MEAGRAVRIALLGCGRQGTKHLASLRKCSGVEVSLADKQPELARALADREGVRWVAEVDEVFADAGISAVDVCVPTPLHAPLIRRALAAGKDFFCEKPLCETAAEARQLMDLARHGGRVGVVGYVYRHAPSLQAARAILGAGGDGRTSPVLGTISVALMRIGGRGSAAVWKHRRAEGGGAINEMLVHMVDLAVWFFGPLEAGELLIDEVLRRRRVIAGRSEEVDAEDFVLARFTSRSGVPIIIQADLLTPSFSQTVEIQGDNGTLMTSIQPEMPHFVFAIRAAGGYPAGRTDLQNPTPNLFDVQMAKFIDAVRTRQPLGDETLADSVLVMQALEGLQQQRRGAP
jgi:myo-inositol 2-dehydrogenase / D-chiro-inositol 1-dehydrogenase